MAAYKVWRSSEAVLYLGSTFENYVSITLKTNNLISGVQNPPPIAVTSHVRCVVQSENRVGFSICIFLLLSLHGVSSRIYAFSQLFLGLQQQVLALFFGPIAITTDKGLGFRPCSRALSRLHFFSMWRVMIIQVLDLVFSEGIWEQIQGLLIQHPKLCQSNFFHIKHTFFRLYWLQTC